MDALSLGALAERFEILSELGRGSFGQVYEAVDRTDGGRVALKVLPVEGDGRREIRELQAALAVRHEHLIGCRDLGVEGDLVWLAMDVADESFVEVLGRGDLDWGWELLRQAAEGLAALHRAGIVHRDFKPGNLLIVDERARVADLGLAKGGDLRTVTAAGVLVGTPAYMAPEQARGDPVGPPADAWALGILFYQLLEGRLPWPFEEPMDLLHRVATGRPQEFHRAHGLLEGEGLAEVARLLDPDPARRPADLEAWARTLGRARWRDPGSEDEASAPGATLLASASELGGEVVGDEVPRGPVPTRVEPMVVAPEGSPGGRMPLAWIRWTGLAVLLAIVLIGGATREGPGAVAPPSSTDPGEPRPPVERLLALLPAVREELSAATLLRQDSTSGEVLPDDDPRASDWPEFLSPDPARYAGVVARLPRLREALDALRADPELVRVDASLTRELAKTDGWFENQGLPRPFDPYLEARPRDPADPEARALLVRQGQTWGGLALAEDAGGWTFAALGHRDALVAIRDRRQAAALAFLRGEEPRALPPALGGLYRTVEGMLGEPRPTRTPVWLPENYDHGPVLRRELAVWLGGREDLRRLILCVVRALRGGEPGGEALVAHFLRWTANLKVFSHDAPFYLPPSVWLPEPSGIAERVVHLRLLEWHDRLHRSQGRLRDRDRRPFVRDVEEVLHELEGNPSRAGKVLIYEAVRMGIVFHLDAPGALATSLDAVEGLLVGRVPRLLATSQNELVSSLRELLPALLEEGRPLRLQEADLRALHDVMSREAAAASEWGRTAAALVPRLAARLGE